MSLTSLLKQPDVKRKFKTTFRKPKIEVPQGNYVAPKTKNYGLVGAAFDYLLRFYIEARASNVHTRSWVAETATKIPKFKRYPDKVQRSALDIVRQAREIHQQYLTDKQLTETVAATTIRLAQVDLLYRPRIVHRELGQVTHSDVLDVMAQGEIIGEKQFMPKNIALLNPTFGEASVMIGGADADLFIDDTLIDIKATKKPYLKRADYNQVIAYYTLFQISGFSHFDTSQASIENIGIYFSRFGYLYTLPFDIIVDPIIYDEFKAWFVERIQTYSDELP